MRLFGQIWIYLGLLIVSPLTFAEDFGVANWGQSLATVRDQEQRPNLTPLTERDYLVYQASLPGIENTRLIYQFEDNLLGTGRFVFTAPVASPADAWIAQFETVRSLITQQYGEPVQQQVLQPPGAGNITPNRWPDALERDALILKTQWQANQTLITQQLAWDGNRPHHQIIYRPIAGEDLSGTGETSPF